MDPDAYLDQKWGHFNGLMECEFTTLNLERLGCKNVKVSSFAGMLLIGFLFIEQTMGSSSPPIINHTKNLITICI